MIIVGVETSCDDTCVAIYDTKSGILCEKKHNQAKLNKKYGGTVPDLASISHFEKLLKLFLLNIKESKITLKKIDLIAYTKGPGLISSLFLGVSFSKSLSFSINKPCIGINHLEAHILISAYYNKNIEFPVLALMISGANTMLIKILNFGSYEILGKSIDDSAGEVFDKISRILNLKYNSGLYLENIAKIKRKYESYSFTKMKVKKIGLNFSFSGFKTNVSNTIKSLSILNYKKHNIAYNFQNTIIKIISNKCYEVLKNFTFKSLILAGGVSSNMALRKELYNISNYFGVKMYCVPKRHCTDNAMMIAFLGYLKYKSKIINKNLYIEAYPDLSIDKSLI